jgi:hypothetical protein
MAMKAEEILQSRRKTSAFDNYLSANTIAYRVNDLAGDNTQSA